MPQDEKVGTQVNGKPKTPILGLSNRVLTSIFTLAILVLALMIAPNLVGNWSELWLTSDQLGQWNYRRGLYISAANAFRDSQWRGMAWYRAGEFEKAADSFALQDTAVAHYNAGNAWLMQGKYQVAIESYDRALSMLPDWIEALENRSIAEARAKVLESKGSSLGDQKIGADKIVFDKNAINEGQETEVEGNKPLSDADIQSLWLRRVQTRPADFLRAKFAYQESLRQNQGD